MLSVLLRVAVVLLVALTLSACAAIAGIFKAGFWVGIVIAAVVIVGIFMLIGRR